MPTDDRPTPIAAPATGPKPRRRPALFLVVTGVAVVAAVCTLTAAYHYWRAPEPTPAPVNEGHGGARQQYFRNWPKPDLVLVLSGQQHGYVLPCGCSKPQYGGLERRYNFLQHLKERGWPVMALDLGDINQRRGPAYLQNVQGLIKYKYTMKALSLMPLQYADFTEPPRPKEPYPPRLGGYAAVTFGEWETMLPLDQALGIWALNEASPRTLSANLAEKDKWFPPPMVWDWQVAQADGSKLKIGVTAVTGPAVAKKIQDPKVRYLDGSTAKVLPDLLKQMEAKSPDLRVLLYQGTLAEAKSCAKAFPQFQVILCLDDDEPPSDADKVMTDAGGTLVVRVGHKGKHLGVVGINRTGKAQPSFELRYQLVTLDEDFLTPDDKVKGHPIIDLMEEYTRELKKENYLAKYGQANHPNQVGQPPDALPTYVGSDTCKKCHEYAHKVWSESKHSHAFKTLVDAKKPSLRQYDPECIVCHTVGFAYKTGFENEQKTPKLKDVGCESCHGPSGLHARRPNDMRWRAMINPWKAKNENETAQEKATRMKRIEREVCIQCHDQDNDVHWTFDKWTKGKIIHMTPQE